MKRPIKTSEESSSYPSDNPINKIIKVQVIKKEIVDVSNNQRKQSSNADLDNNLKKSDSIRNKYKFG